jgi:hypothetical protein
MPDPQQAPFKQTAFVDSQHVEPHTMPDSQHAPFKQTALVEVQQCGPQQGVPSTQQLPLQRYFPVAQVFSAFCPIAADCKPNAANRAPPSMPPTVPSIFRRETGLAIARDISSNSKLMVVSAVLCFRLVGEG